MASLYFKYGVMGAAKSAELLTTKYRYEETGQKVMCLKADRDTRDGECIIKSRLGLSAKANNVSEIIGKSKTYFCGYSIILVDEAQFCTTEEIDLFAKIVDEYNVPVICYGLKTDFQNHLFEGSKRLLEIADNISEIRTVCWCGKKAICNARYNEFGIVRTGEQIMLGANDQYVSLCRKHYNAGMIE